MGRINIIAATPETMSNKLRVGRGIKPKRRINKPGLSLLSLQITARMQCSDQQGNRDHKNCCIGQGEFNRYYTLDYNIQALGNTALRNAHEINLFHAHYLSTLANVFYTLHKLITILKNIIMAKILIVGCGKIGSKLAEVLHKQGHQVTGLKRKPPSVISSCINYVAADISSPAELANLDTDFTQVFFIVSPSDKNEQSYRSVYETGLTNLLTRLPKAHWLMVSSTSVYGQSQGEWVDENSVAEPDNMTSQLIRLAEKRIVAANQGNIVLRFSGIYGPGRDYLLRQARQVPAIQQSPSYFTNRIHQQDCIGVLCFLLEQQLAGKALAQYYLVSDDDPAPMWEVMNWLADHLHCSPPKALTISANAGMNKRCNNASIKTLGYQFLYPSYKDGYLEFDLYD